MFGTTKRVVITGGLGFIGKYFVKRLLAMKHEVMNLDKMTYAADKKIQPWFYEHDNYSFLHGDIADVNTLPECDIVVNIAAESHVDNAIRKSRHFTVSNVIGVQNLLELIRDYSPSLRPVFVQISTDEVYGDNITGLFHEDAFLRPSNPYAASKAAAEHIIQAYARTYGITYQIVRMSNNYGVRQYPEKLVPRSVVRLIEGRKAQLHGNGSYRRAWLHVEDAVQGILAIADKGEINGIYNITSDVELSNIDVVRKIVDYMGLGFDESVEFVDNRPGQDVRYGIDDSKVRALGWKPKKDFDDALGEIIEDVRENPHWGGLFHRE